MSDAPNRRAVIVGIFVFLGIAFLIAGILMVGNLHETFKRKIELVTLFDDVNGLQTGNNIWFSGVKIGTVSDLHLFGKSQVAVRMKIETKVQDFIHKDAKVRISTDGLIGNKILVIYGGSADFAQVQEGDTLVVEKTISTEDMMNTLQKNNENLLAITTDFKSISKKLTTSDGTLGKLLNDNSLYDNMNATTVTLKDASSRARELVGALNQYSAGLNTKGTFANDLVSDTMIFHSARAIANSAKLTVEQLQQIADTAAVFIADLKKAGNNPKSTVGVLIHDERAGAYMKETIKNLESSSKKLDEDLEALQHNFLLRGYFKKKAKAAKKNAQKTDAAINN